ncbi:Hypothetical predicted protein [Mytilus galloprovincialis]|uniref:CARD domain-containing protein n=1 Tax=Mytilus galloprovincialis TaxID=29158 RepID=A0A8B6G3M4_MYTGA|nr:Hypothetical predicted protein [Mytilus galloprovincialis]
MDAREKQKLTTNEQYLCDNVISGAILPKLIQDGVLTPDDEQRIRFEATESSKIHRLLRILEEHPKGFHCLCNALKGEQMVYIAEALEQSPIDEKAVEREQQWSDAKIEMVLKRNFSPKLDHRVYLGSIIEDLRFQFRIDGCAYHLHEDHVIRRVQNIFPNVLILKNKKDKGVFIGEKRQQTAVDGQHSETTQNLKIKALEELSPGELVEVITHRLEEHEVPLEALENIIDGELTGKHFKRLKMKYMQDIFPNFTKGNKLSLLNLRDDILEEFQIEKETQQNQNIATDKQNRDVEEKDFLEVFKKFDKEARATDCYRKDAVLKTSITRPSNLLEPVHIFSSVTSNKVYTIISDEIVEFAAACLNERSNGTIHFGIVPRQTEYFLEGVIKGLEFEREPCLKSIYRQIEERFYKDQISVVLRCVRPPQFIEVTSKTDDTCRLYVLEVDIIPDSAFIKEEAFFVKGRVKSSPILYLFKELGITPKRVSDEETRTYMSKHKVLISDCRKKQERRPVTQVVKHDLRQKMLDCICSGEDRMPSDIYPLVFLSPFENVEDTVIVKDNFEFLVDLDANAIFDFDYSKHNNGLFRYVETEKNQVLTALTTDNFDPLSDENQMLRDSHSNLLEDIKQPNIKPWVFCNGYEPMSKFPMTRKEWKQNRLKGFKEVIRFYSNEIPSDRALILFFLFSKHYDIMLEAADEVILNFKDQWVVMAESEEIAYQWCSELIRRETVDKKEIERRAILGMPWSHVNQTIHQLSGVSRPIRCEIPTSTGAFCHLREKDKNKLHDIEILSRNECDDPEIVNDRLQLTQIRRKVAETFYRGGAVSWWNFWFPDHVLKRDVHKKLKKKIKEAITGNRTEEDNKIGLVNIYHQPGAGGTTTAMHVLWELRTKYRCCIVKQLTDQTVDQISDLRTYEDKGDPKPPLILIDNGDEEKVGELFAVLQNRAKIVARRGSSDMKVFCVLLLCIRRSIITSKDEMSVALRHDLSPTELDWFRTKHAALEIQFKDKKGPDPKFLVSFNILKENFNREYIHRTAKELVKGVVDSNERLLLKYLSLLNTFDLDCQSIPISAFDPIMTIGRQSRSIIFGLAADCGRRRKTDWENEMGQPLQVLLNQSCRAGLGKQLIGLSIINPLFAQEIFSCFNQPPACTSSIVHEFLDSEIFRSSNMSSKEVMKIVKSIMRKREEKEYSIKVKFSPLIMKLLKEENDERATEVLIKVYHMTKDPMICQHIARLYMHFQNWDRAAEYAEIATSSKPQNSSLWDTYGQVYKNKLLSKYIAISQEGKDLSDEEIEEAIEIAKLGIANFKKEQEVSEAEFFNKGNDAGYYGELKMVILLLDIFRFCKLGREKVHLHKYLTDKTFIPTEMSRLKSESIDFMKNLEANSETAIQTIEEKLTQLKDDLYYSVFGKQMLAKNAVATLRENIDSYFGEESDKIPPSLSSSEKAAYRRRRVRRIGGRSLFNFLRIEAEENLPVILDMLLENVRSEFWEIFDIINLINVVIAMKIKKIPQDQLEYSELVHYSRKCYEKAILCTDKRPYLEVFMYFVLFNWPTAARQKQSLCSVDQLRDATKRWKAAFLENHPRQKETKPIRKRETTILFLGNGIDMNAIVHYEELHDPQGKKFIKGDRVWETEDFIRKLLRLPGTLIEGTEVSCNIETLSGSISNFVIPTSVHILNRALWQKRIYFILGFSWAGIKAFDVREQMPEASRQEMSPSLETGISTQQSVNTRKNVGRIKTHDQFMDNYVRLRTQMEKITKEMTSEDYGEKDLQMLKDKHKDVRSELEKLIKAREDFYSN